MRGVLDPPVSVFSLSLYRHPFLHTLFSSRVTLIINNNIVYGFVFGSVFLRRHRTEEYIWKDKDTVPVRKTVEGISLDHVSTLCSRGENDTDFFFVGTTTHRRKEIGDCHLDD